MSSYTPSKAPSVNWQLALLMLTAIALSVASGWTTWDGMSNFTDSPWLSFLITFGIQGVMLVTAWLIGRSFVAEAHIEDHVQQRSDGGTARVASSILLGVALVLAGVIALALFDALPVPYKTYVGDGLPIIKLGLLVGALVLGSAILRFQEISAAYARSVRAIARNLPLWSMFLLCMMASVFFSFDSLFAKIYPPEERTRASDIRAQRDLSVVLTKAAEGVGEREAQAIHALLDSDAWRTYNANLQELSTAAGKTPAALQAKRLQEAAAASATISRYRSELARLEAQKAALQARRSMLAKQVESLRDALSSHRTKMEDFSAERERTVSSLTALESQMEAERRGVGRTGKAGIGPAYRALKQQHVQLEIKLEELRQRIDEHAERRAQIMSRLALQEKTSAQLAGEMARLLSQIDVASRELESASRGDASGTSQVLAAIAASTREIAAARKSFLQSASADDLVALQQACGKMRSDLLTADQMLRSGQSNIDCGIGDLTGYVGSIAERRRTAQEFAANCGSSAITADASTTALLDLGRRCVRTAALDPAATADLGSTLNRIALRRDDTAHRFVVTTNAFLDGNQLAYLALIIAFAIDALVFMSGLYGAAAEDASRTRGSLKTIPLIERLSGPARFQVMLSRTADASTGDAVKALLKKVKPVQHEHGYAFELHQDDDQPNDITSLLNAGIAAGTVTWQYGALPRYPRYLIMPMFFASLARAANLPERGYDGERRRDEARIDRLAG